MWKCLALGWIVGVACIGRVDLWWMPEKSILFLLGMLWIGLCWARVYLPPSLIAVVLHLLLMILGCGLGYRHADQHLQLRLEQRVMQQHLAEGLIYIKKINQLSERGLQQRVDWIGTDGKARQGIVFLNQKQAEQFDLRLGHYYHVQAELRPIHGFAVAGVFDQEQWALQQNLMFRMQIESAIPQNIDQVIKYIGPHYPDQQMTLHAKFSLWMEQQRFALREFIGQGAFQNKGLLLGLLTGDESYLSQELQDQFQRMGMSHLLAISGPHVLVFAILMCWVLQQAIQRFKPELFLVVPRQILMVVPFLCCVALYCLFVGAEIPALRTFLMCLLISVAVLTGLALKPLSLLLCSACVLLYFDPFSVLSAAFWLSYGACFILLRIYQTIQHTPQTQQGARKYIQILIALVESQWKIFVALLPLMIIFFKHVAWIAPLTNIIAIPWLGLLVVPLDILAACSFFVFEPLATFLLSINDHIISLLLWLLDRIDQLFQPRLIAVPFHQTMIYCLILGLILLFLPQGAVPKAWSAIALFPMLGVAHTPSPLQVTLLDVGQGQAVFIQDQNKTMMIDVGGRANENEKGIGNQVILPFLLSQGVGQLDHVVLTHLDHDHSGALPSLARRIPISKIISNENPSELAALPFDYCTKGQYWQWSDDIEIHILAPQHKAEQRKAEERNEYSCVMYIRLKNGQPYQNFLLMGDAGWQTEYQLMHDYPDLPVDVLVLGHHGSKHSSAYDFLKHYQPKLALVSAGYANRYQHPTAITQARLQALGIPLYSTIQHGSLYFIKQEHRVILETHRSKRVWLNRITP